MSQTIKLSKAEVKIKDSFKRSERRELQSRILDKVELDLNKPGKVPAAMLVNGQYEAMLFVIEEIKVGEELKPITQATLDDEELFTDEDIAKLEAEINAVTEAKKTELKKK